MQQLTIKFDRLDDGTVKATVFEGTNKFLYVVHAETEGLCLEQIVPKHTSSERVERLKDALSRRVD